MSEFVMVKRELLERILSYSWFPEGGTQNGIDRRFLDRDELRAVLAQEAGRGDVLAWLLTGSETFEDTVTLREDYADDWMSDRDGDSSVKIPLYASPPAPVSHQKPIAYMRNEGTPNNLVKCTFTCPGAFGVYRNPVAPVTAVLLSTTTRSLINDQSRID